MSVKRDSVKITKASGEQVPFSEEKLKVSLHRSGASNEVIASVIEEVKRELYEGMPTKNIYKLAFGLLKKASTHYAARYKLKSAIMELGPSGFPFEKYFSEIMKFRGYRTEVGTTVEGQCVSHEVDVIASKDKDFFMIECKYHNYPGISCDVKIPLYINSRFKDVEFTWKKLPGHDKLRHQGWLVTNTKFTDDAIQYANCAGLHLVGWNYPVDNNLKNWIDQSTLYPITCLTTITNGEKRLLLDKNIVLCKEICSNIELLGAANIQKTRYKNIQREIDTLCKGIPMEEE